MKISGLRHFILITLLGTLCFACSMIGPGKTDSTAANNSGNSIGTAKSTETAAATPCENKYYPVKNGSVKNYESNTPLGKSKAHIVQKYNPGESTFTEEWTFDKSTLTHVWQCTNEGIIAPNYGSSLNTENAKITPKHISGVTLPREDQMTVGKTWTVVYEAESELPSGMGKSLSTVTVNNKIVSLDDEVKTAGGTFKAARIEMDVNIETTFNGKKMPIPTIKTAAWFSPGVGLVKSGNIDGKFGNITSEYTGNE